MLSRFRLERLNLADRQLLGVLASRYSSSSAQISVREELSRIKQLREKVSSVNSKTDKQVIIAQYPELRNILEHVYDPNHRTHLTSKVLFKHLDASSNRPVPSNSHIPDTLSELFDHLSSRTSTGNASKDLVTGFLIKHDIMKTDLEGSEELLEMFGKLLDRNLTAGFGAKTLSEVQWGVSSEPAVTAASQGIRSQSITSSPSVPSSRSAMTSRAGLPSARRNLTKFECALGKTIEPPFRELSKQSKWYASRKLDGVRCLTFVDFELAPGQPPRVVDVQFLSRTGKPFTSLGNLATQLAVIAEFPKLEEWLEKDSAVVEETEDGIVKRLVLDGEVCVMRERKTNVPVAPSNTAETSSGAAALWTVTDNLEEDFTSTVSEVRRGNHTIRHPAYFIFDILSWAEFSAKTGLSPPLGKTFGQRIEDIRSLGEWLHGELEIRGIKEKFLRPLNQWQIQDISDVDEMVKRAADDGWEGLIFRADKPYKGSRSSDIRKFKQWQDAEYTVKSVDTSTMRLAVDGVFGDYKACSNVWIDHKGTPVSIGSGFSVDQRLRYAENPELIIGKQITVEYFSESEAVGRGEGKSLRFPRVKTIWEDGKRDL